MRTAVYFEGRRAGSLDWRQESGGVRAVLDCELCSACILRVYAETEGAAPLYCRSARAAGRQAAPARRLSAETLRQAGWTGKEPLRVYLAERQEQTPRVEPEKRAPRTEPPCIEPPRTGDAVLDALIEAGAVSAVRTENGGRLSCPFSPHELVRPRAGLRAVPRGAGRQRCSTGKQKAQPNRLRPRNGMIFTLR
ncbi:MAG: hypothetical protein ACLR4Z_08625 [Butyricicoccaceae bacterium]